MKRSKSDLVAEYHSIKKSHVYYRISAAIFLAIGIAMLFYLLANNLELTLVTLTIPLLFIAVGVTHYYGGRLDLYKTQVEKLESLTEVLHEDKSTEIDEHRGLKFRVDKPRPMD